MSDIGPNHEQFRGMAKLFALPPLTPGADGARPPDAFAPNPDPRGAGRGNSAITEALVARAADRASPARGSAGRHR